MQKPFYLYVRFCRLFGLTPLHFRGKLLIPAEADTICVNLASYGLDDTHALAYVLTLMRIANLPPAVMLKFLRAYLRTCGTSAAEQVIQTAVDSSAMEQLLSFDAPTSSDVKRTQFSYWHFEGNPLTGKGASLVVAAAIILGGGHLELEMSNCPQVFDLELTAWLDLIEYLRQERGSAPFGLRGLRVDGCPLQKFTCQPDRILTDLEWLSLRGTAFKNLWTTASLLTELPSLRAILIRGSPKTMRQLDHVRKISLGLGNRNSRPSSDSAASSGGSYRSSISQSGPEIERHNVELKKSSDVESVYVRARPRWAHLRGNDAVPDEIPYLQYRRDVLNGQDWKITAETPVSRRAHYREFLLAHAKPALISLDAVPLTARECEIARRDVLRHFDVVLPDPPHNPATLFRQIRDRELEISNSHAVIWTKSRSSLDSNPKRRRNGNYDQPSDGGSSAEPHGLRKISAVDNGLSSLGRIHREESANLGGTATRSSISSSAALEAFSGRVFNLVSAECANFVKGQSEKMPSVLDGQSRKRPVVPRSPAAYLSDNFVSSDFERDSSISLLGRPGQPRIEYLCEPHDRPRQFEYNHIDPRLLVYGTEHANLVVLNQDTGTVVGSCRTGGGKGHIAPGASVRTNRSELPGLSRPCNLPVDEEQSSSVLGLSWFNKDPNRFIAGSESGQIHVYNVNWMQSGHNGGCMYACDTFPRLTSIHANCSDEKFIVSGYSREVGLYDLETGKQVESIRNCHQDHINVLKFAHCNPHIFVTSSFDRYVKKWDLRESRPGGSRRPIFQRQSETGNVMVCFSPDDEYLLVSAINNEVLQYTASDGRLERSFDIPKSNNSHNYTRSYYMNGRDYIISGSCTEDVVRVYNARTGQFFKEIDMDNRRGSRDRTIYVQSLRANPRHQFSFSALLSLHGNAPYLIIARTDLHSRVIE